MILKNSRIFIEAHKFFNIVFVIILKKFEILKLNYIVNKILLKVKNNPIYLASLLYKKIVYILFNKFK